MESLVPFASRMVSSLVIMLYELVMSAVVWVLERLLLTDESLQNQLDRLDQEAEDFDREESHPRRLPLLKVTEMKDKKLTINIQAANADNEDDDYDPPSSADIEVVHKKAPPKLHSILKQRTLSESSDEHGCSGGESPRSDDSPSDGCKKSVSFNQRDDSITFKKNTAPTSMKSALKSKRRRARKKEEKRVGRKRKNSGSEGSSGEELSHESHSLSDEKTDEEDAHFDQIEEDDEGEIAEVKKAAGDRNVKRVEDVEGKVKVEQGETTEADGEGDVMADKEDRKGSVKASKDNQDFRTSNITDCDAVSEKKKKMVDEIKKQINAPESNMADSDDEGIECDTSLDDRTIKEEARVCESMNGMSLKDASDAAKTPQRVECSQDAVISSTISSPGDLKHIIETQDSPVIKIQAPNKDSQKLETSEFLQSEDTGKGDNSNDEKVDTMLSWKESVSDPLNDHKTQCAFTFTNSVIYDLDVD